MNKDHLRHINLAHALYRDQLLALNKERLVRYLDASYPTISQRSLQGVIDRQMKNFTENPNFKVQWMYNDIQISEKILMINTMAQ